MARQNKRGEDAGKQPASSPDNAQKDTGTATPRIIATRRRHAQPAKRLERQDKPPVSTSSSISEEGDATDIKLVHPRLLVKNLENQAELVRQRQEYGPDVSRRTFNRGDRVESALGPADPGTGRRGKFDSSRLAEELIGDINGLIEFALENERVPTRIRMLAEQVEALENISSFLRVELRSILQSIIQEEVHAALQRELLPLLQRVSAATFQIVSAPTEPEVAQGLLTDVAPGAQSLLDTLFGN